MGVPKATVWWLAEIGWRCCRVGAWNASTNKLQRKEPAIVLLSVTSGPKWCGCDAREREKEKKERKKNELCGHKSNWLIHLDFHF